MNDNFSIDNLNSTKSRIYYSINDIVDILTKISSTTNSLFSNLSQIDTEDRTMVNKCGQYNLVLKTNRDEINNQLDEFLTIIDSYIRQEKDIDGYTDHLFSNISDEMIDIDQRISNL